MTGFLSYVKNFFAYVEKTRDLVGLEANARHSNRCRSAARPNIAKCVAYSERRDPKLSHGTSHATNSARVRAHSAAKVACSSWGVFILGTD